MRLAELDVGAHPKYADLHSSYQLYAGNAAAVLNYCAARGLIDLGNVERSIDFGARFGEATLALAQLALQNGGDAEAVEINPDAAYFLQRGRLRNEVRVHVADGIALLGSRESANRYDLITAYMLGPDYQGELAQDLVRVSDNALREDGRLVITSDRRTMEAARTVCEQEDVHHEFIPGVPLTDKPTTVNVIVASFPPGTVT